MKKLIAVLSVALVLVFSCVLTSFADDTTILTLANLSDSRLVKSGNATVANGVVTVPAGGSYSAYIRVKPISATRKYKFSFYYGCSSVVGGSFSLSGSLRIYYKDSSSGAELTVLELSKFTNADIQKYNTLTMPDDFGDAGRLYFVFKNISLQFLFLLSCKIASFSIFEYPFFLSFLFFHLFFYFCCFLCRLPILHILVLLLLLYILFCFLDYILLSYCFLCYFCFFSTIISLIVDCLNVFCCFSCFCLAEIMGMGLGL